MIKPKLFQALSISAVTLSPVSVYGQETQEQRRPHQDIHQVQSDTNQLILDCGEHGHPHENHCHCDEGYIEINGKCESDENN